MAGGGPATSREQGTQIHLLAIWRPLKDVNRSHMLLSASLRMIENRITIHPRASDGCRTDTGISKSRHQARTARTSAADPAGLGENVHDERGHSKKENNQGERHGVEMVEKLTAAGQSVGHHRERVLESGLPRIRGGVVLLPCHLFVGRHHDRRRGAHRRRHHLV